MDNQWIIHGQSIDHPWIIHAVSMEYPWIIYGVSIEYPWNTPCMVCTGPQYIYIYIYILYIRIHFGSSDLWSASALHHQQRARQVVMEAGLGGTKATQHGLVLVPAAHRRAAAEGK